jgi:DNA-binding IclR family transcriptional regulator
VTDATAPYEVRAISRAFEILGHVEDGPGGISLNELVRRSALTKPTVFRMVKNLEHVGLVARVPGTDTYQLGLRCIRLGQAYLQQTDFRREALPVMERLRDAFNETVHLAVLDERLRVVYLEKLGGSHAVGIMMSAVGGTAPSYCTGLGKALLAARDDDPVAILQERGELKRKTSTTIWRPDALRRELATIAERGYSLDLEEHEPGVRCVATTIRGANGDPIAALSVAGPVGRMPEDLLTGELAEAVVKAAREIGRRVGSAEPESD